MNTVVSFQIEKKQVDITVSHPGFSWTSQAKIKNDVKKVLAGFKSVNLAELDKKSLMNRVDTRFLIDSDIFFQILGDLEKDYFVLEINGLRINFYETLYYDTAHLDFYLSHHNGALNRYKVRSRQYVNSHLSFLEVKFKNNKKRTVKSRMKINGFRKGFDGQALGFLKDNCTFDPQLLEPSLWNAFYRITLASRENIERLTLDLFLEISNKSGRVAFPNVVIAEVKQEEFSLDSVFMQRMRENDTRPGGFSKYCLGTALLNQRIKSNNFKPEILKLKKILNGEIVYARNN